MGLAPVRFRWVALYGPPGFGKLANDFGGSGFSSDQIDREQIVAFELYARGRQSAVARFDIDSPRERFVYRMRRTLHPGRAETPTVHLIAARSSDGDRVMLVAEPAGVITLSDGFYDDHEFLNTPRLRSFERWEGEKYELIHEAG